MMSWSRRAGAEWLTDVPRMTCEKRDTTSNG